MDSKNKIIKFYYGKKWRCVSIYLKVLQYLIGRHILNSKRTNMFERVWVSWSGGLTSTCQTKVVSMRDIALLFQWITSYYEIHIYTRIWLLFTLE